MSKGPNRIGVQCDCEQGMYRLHSVQYYPSRSVPLLVFFFFFSVFVTGRIKFQFTFDCTFQCVQRVCRYITRHVTRMTLDHQLHFQSKKKYTSPFRKHLKLRFVAKSTAWIVWLHPSANSGNRLILLFFTTIRKGCRCQWPCGLRRGSAAARLLGLWVRILPGGWLSGCCDCCVLSSTGLCVGLITRQEESYSVWCV
jgi:hypothetical protein